MKSRAHILLLTFCCSLFTIAYAGEPKPQETALPDAIQKEFDALHRVLNRTRAQHDATTIVLRYKLQNWRALALLSSAVAVGAITYHRHQNACDALLNTFKNNVRGAMNTIANDLNSMIQAGKQTIHHTRIRLSEQLKPADAQTPPAEPTAAVAAPVEPRLPHQTIPLDPEKTDSYQK